MNERLAAGKRQPGCRADDVSFHNAAVNHVLRIVARHAVHRHRAHQVGFKRNDVASGLNLLCHEARVNFTHLNGVFLSCRCNLNHVKPPVGESSH